MVSLCATIDFAPFWLLKRMVDFVEIAIEQGEDTALKNMNWEEICNE